MIKSTFKKSGAKHSIHFLQLRMKVDKVEFFKSGYYMAFRKFGGLNYAPNSNIVRNHYANSDNFTVSENIGLENTKTISLTNIDLSGNSIFNVGCIYFGDGTSQCTASVSASASVNANGPLTYNTKDSSNNNDAIYDILINEIGNLIQKNNVLTNNNNVLLSRMNFLENKFNELSYLITPSNSLDTAEPLLENSQALTKYIHVESDSIVTTNNNFETDALALTGAVETLTEITSVLSSRVEFIENKVNLYF
jgi:hypothetical protein